MNIYFDNSLRSGERQILLRERPAVQKRLFAQDAQEPLGRHYVFIRSHWQDAFEKHLDLTGILQINIQDGSFFAQPMGEYHLSSVLTLALTLNLFIGPERSEFGSLQQWGNIKGGFTYYF